MPSLPKNFITDLDIRESYAEDAAGHMLLPDYVVRPESMEELSECLAYCNRERISLTPSGQRTNYEASGLASNGVLLSLERMKRILDINLDEGYVEAEPGILLGDLKRKLAEHDLFYPPDPSSENIAALGGTVGTNAAGARSFKYGPTANYVLGMNVALADGTVEELRSSQTTKMTTGPSALSRMGSLFVGSEGVLGVFASIRLKVIQRVPNAVGVVAFFRSIKDVVNFAVGLQTGTYPQISPRSLEFLDKSCLELLRSSGKFPQVPVTGDAALVCEQEYFDEDISQVIEPWLEVLEKAGAQIDHSIVADSEVKIIELRELRHYVPSKLNELASESRKSGGRKVSTDWAVPVRKLGKMIAEAEKLCAELGFPPERVYRYAHLGDGHPHYNFIAKDGDELERCFLLREKLAALAVSLGGTVAAEHGLGKEKKKLLKFEKPNLKLRLLRAMKSELDPNGILSPGNIF